MYELDRAVFTFFVPVYWLLWLAGGLLFLWLLGVLMHAVLLQHGGLTAVGVNILVLGLPAMVMGAMSQRLSDKIPVKIDLVSWGRGNCGSLFAFNSSFLVDYIICRPEIDGAHRSVGGDARAYYVV